MVEGIVREEVLAVILGDIDLLQVAWYLVPRQMQCVGLLAVMDLCMSEPRLYG